jgi:membrane protease YdiL (CAAX protease family)
MTPLTLTLHPTMRSDILSAIYGIFFLFIIGSFITVAVYTARQIRTGRLINNGNAPLALTMPHLAGWFFVISVIDLIFLEPSLYILLVLIGTVGVLLENGRTAQTQFGFDRLNPVRAISWSLLAFGAVMLVETPLTEVSSWALDNLHIVHPEQESVETFREYNDPASIFLFLFQAVFLSPIIEELFFRGFLLTFLKNYTSTWMAIILSAGVFACVHLNLGAFIPLWFLGIFLGLAYEHTGSLLVPMGIHGCFNLATGLFLLLDKGNS